MKQRRLDLCRFLLHLASQSVGRYVSPCAFYEFLPPGGRFTISGNVCSRVRLRRSQGTKNEHPRHYAARSQRAH